MKKYIKSMRDYPDLADEYKINGVENEIIRYLDSGKKVFIESGAANDQILSYSDPYGYGREIVFTTSGSIFPKQICLFDYSYVDCEDFEGSLFVQVG